MKNSKKVLITTATSEIFVVRRPRQKTFREFCPQCETEMEMLDFNSAVTFFRIRAHELIRQIEAGAIHSIETVNGHLFVCKREEK